MATKEKLLDDIKKYYLKSYDFNGIPLSQFNNYDFSVLSELIDDDMIFILSGNDVLNPYINRYGSEVDKETQKNYLYNKDEYAVIYPSKKALKFTRKIEGKPYTNMLRKGESQLKKIFFDVEILDRYFNNPKYDIQDRGYRGNIILKHEFARDISLKDDFIKDYGMAYSKDAPFERVICVFLKDLSDLSAKKQQLWKSFEKENQEKYFVNNDFVKNLECGQWSDNLWTFEAVLRIMILINAQCNAIGIPPLFLKTYNVDDMEWPEDFRIIFSPTKKNYHNFLLVIEKLFIGKINIHTFLRKAPYVKNIERKDENDKDKSSLNMLEEWLNKNIRFKNGCAKDIVKPLRVIRRERQIPAHELEENEYSLKYYEIQNKHISDIYWCLSNITIFLSKHPLACSVEIPDYLLDTEHLVNY